MRIILSVLMTGGALYCATVSASNFADSFSGEAQQSWGSSWNVSSRPERLSVSNGNGFVKHDSQGSAEVYVSGYTNISNAEVSVQMQFPDVPVTGYADGSIHLRQYYFRIRYSDTSLRLVIEHRSDGVVDKLVNIPLGLERTSVKYNLRAVVTGKEKVRIAAQVWQEGQLPPSGWLVDMVDTSLLTKAETGTAGVKSGLGSQSEGGALVVFDNFSLSECSHPLCGLPLNSAIVNLVLFKCPVNTEIRGIGHPFWNSYGCVGQITDQATCSTVTFVRDNYIFTDYACEPL